MEKRHKYTREEDNFLIKNVKGKTLKELTNMINKEFDLNLTENSISNRKVKLGIKSGNIGGRFEKGHIPANKGKPMKPEQYEKCKKTMFKRGHIPANRREVGSERVTKDGYLKIKIQDGQGNKNWILKHRFIYEQVNGPIPKRHKVIFADGNKRNFEIDNLLLVSYSEQLIINKNNLLKSDKELTKTGVTIAKVMNKVNKRKKDL